MAHSRLERVGTIFSRVSSLIKTGSITEHNIPIWYKIYKSFPPKYEPTFSRPASQKPLRNIFYEEDVLRAKFHKNTTFLPSVDLETTGTTETQLFLDKYSHYLQDGFPESEAFDRAMSKYMSHSSSGIEKFKKSQHAESQQLSDSKVETKT
ncbi:mitochondrial ribosomal protein S23 [Lasioglossum baleicum]|uniref:mitochondrial ribosomal protein S23 n=1 Tax=Lasioglossum baleicum TaxID=434251 RepID=UPI003FCD3A16